MRYISAYKILFLIIMTASLSCTHNNGDIGPIFGQWKLTSIFINDKEDQGYKENIFFAFQNDVTSMRIVRENQDVSETFGHWKLDGDILLLIYDDPDLEPLSETYFTEGVNTCEIITLSGKELILKREANGNIYIYRLKKW